MATLRSDWKATGSYGTIGLEVVLSVLVGLGGGIWIDSKLDSAPVAAIIGMVLGVAAAIRAVYRAAKQMKYDTEHDGFVDHDTDRPAAGKARARLERLADLDRRIATARRRAEGRAGTRDALVPDASVDGGRSAASDEPARGDTKPAVDETPDGDPAAGDDSAEEPRS